MPYLDHHRLRGKRGPKYKGFKREAGYVLRLVPDHPHAVGHGYVPEHRLVMEQALGRYLTRDEIVHHINGVKDDNRPENLRAMSQSEHQRLHYPDKPTFHRRAPGWSLTHAACVSCGKTEHKHQAHGLCYECFKGSLRKHDPARWSRQADACVECGTTERPHWCGGLCTRCYSRRNARAMKAKERAQIAQM